MMSAIRRLPALIFLLLFVLVSQAQPVTDEPVKPYKLFTTGKQVIIKSTKGIRQVMLWTLNGNRVVEQRAINNNSYVLDIPVKHKAFFLMIGLSDGKVYTEKIGIP